MATVASTMQSWDAVTGGVKRALRNVVAMQITASNALVVAQAPGGTGFNQLATAANVLEFAVPDLLDSDEVLGAEMTGTDANISIIGAWRSASGASPKVKASFFNAGPANTNIAADPVVIVVYVARR